MENHGRKFTVPVKSLKEQKLPPQWLFDNARGVMSSHLAIKVKPKSQLLKMVTKKVWKSPLPVYLVINYGYIFVYTKKECGFAVNIRASGMVNKFENIKKVSPFHGQILIPFKHAVLKLDFEDSEEYKQWVHLLKAIVNSKIDGEWLKRAGYVFSQKEQVIAEKVEPPVGQKKDSDWVEVRRYPANTIDLNATVFEETILEDVDDDEISTFSPGRSSNRRDEYEFDLENYSDAGSEVFEEEPYFSLDGTDGNEEELSAAAAFLNRTPMTVSGNLAYLAAVRASLGQPPATRRSPSRAPSSLRSQASVESFDESNADEIYGRNVSSILSHVSPRSTVADSRVHPAFRSPSISRTPSTRRSPSRAPSLRSEARVPASPFSLPNESFSESNEDRGVIFAHASPSPARTPSHAPTPRRAPTQSPARTPSRAPTQSPARTPSRARTPRRAPTQSPARTPSRAPTPRRVAAAAALSEVSESFASRGDDPSYVPSEDSQATATSSLRALQDRTSFHPPQALRRSERPTKKPQIFGRDY